jgi:MYXO-CTERM domain-containing protein
VSAHCSCCDGVKREEIDDMKNLISFLVLLAGVTGALAQGTVTFVNSGQFPTTADRLVYADYLDGRGPVPLVGQNFVAQLYYGADAGSLAPHSAVPSRFRVPTTVIPGTWSGGTRTLEGFTSGQVVTMQVRIWDAGNTSGTPLISWDQASIRKAYGIFTYVVPPLGAPAAQYLMDNLRSFYPPLIVPEPSVIGFGLLGVGALFLLRRRKA